MLTNQGTHDTDQGLDGQLTMLGIYTYTWTSLVALFILDHKGQVQINRQAGDYYQDFVHFFEFWLFLERS